MAQLLNPNELKNISEAAEMEKIKEMLARKRQADTRDDDLKKTFESREVSPLAAERINTAVRAAAERGAREVQVLRFPASYCNDGGRRINIGDPDWPISLEGFGKTAYNYFEKELRPLGYKLRAEIVSFPEGLPGDVGIYLAW
ncbi:hypothetical protein G3545_03370 [Starkeya sp. ORNL1]|uniref:hypothetical protein n=1 Tax=Starkeya sp. ORNL1 TaxID=2709380 RepID=UPI0014630E00|nr:hypothetical protein [Starkeya sp. ORNL1]QJP12784.1 hypothetical protein G3545_03370 [Starkeya sp. ORNL1]